MSFSIEFLKMISGKWHKYPEMEFNGMTLDQVLEFVIEKPIMAVIDFGMEKGVIAGSAECLTEKWKHSMLASDALMLLRSGAPQILQLPIVLDPSKLFVKPALEKTSPTTESSKTPPRFFADHHHADEGDDLPPEAFQEEIPFLPKTPSLEQSNQILSKSLELILKEDFDGAASLLEDGLKKDHTNSRLHAALGYALHEAGDDNKALVAYKKALELKDQSWKTLFNLGRLLISKDQPRDAMRYLEKAFEMQPDERIRERLVTACTMCGEMEKANRYSERGRQRAA